MTTPTPQCDVEFEDGRRCGKPAGHWNPRTQDPHVPARDDILAQRIEAALRTAGSDYPCTCGSTAWFHCVHPGALSWEARRTAALLPLFAEEREAAYRDAAAVADDAGGVYAEHGDTACAGAVFAVMQRLVAKATGCSWPPCDDEETCAEHERETLTEPA